jgi:hypothetical protein
VAAVVYHHDLSMDGEIDDRNIFLQMYQVVKTFNGCSTVQFYAFANTFRVLTYF